MKKKTMITIGAIAGAGLGAAIITDIIMRRSARIEKEKQLLIESIRRFMKANKVGVYDYDTQLYVKGLLLNGKSLSEREIEELFEKVKEVVK